MEISPRTRKFCPSYNWDGAYGQWHCAESTETVGWDKHPKWCNELETALNQTAAQIKGARYGTKFAAMAEDLAQKLFPSPATAGACAEPTPPPPPPAEKGDPKKGDPKKPAAGAPPAKK